MATPIFIYKHVFVLMLLMYHVILESLSTSWIIASEDFFHSRKQKLQDSIIVMKTMRITPNYLQNINMF